MFKTAGGAAPRGLRDHWLERRFKLSVLCSNRLLSPFAFCLALVASSHHVMSKRRLRPWFCRRFWRGAALRQRAEKEFPREETREAARGEGAPESECKGAGCWDSLLMGSSLAAKATGLWFSSIGQVPKDSQLSCSMFGTGDHHVIW